MPWLFTQDAGESTSYLPGRHNRHGKKTMMTTDTSPAPYQQTAAAVVAAQETDASRGLAQTEVHSRLDRFGRNELLAKETVPWWKKFLAQFKNILVVLLLIASTISVAL
ncbi:MAG TPA: cation-transporting P-type ATPase, partial [Clostridia bacterium]|nr:cation-transporting P-type ATPase [Clostridia bacterium]